MTPETRQILRTSLLEIANMSKPYSVSIALLASGVRDRGLRGIEETATLQIGGGAATSLDVLGITSAQLTLTARGIDSLTVTVPGPIDGTPLIAPFQKCTLREGSTVRFIGWLDRAPKQASGSDEFHSYMLNGPMRWLDRVFWTDSETGGYRALTAPGETAETIAPLDTTIRSILDAVVAAHGGSVAYVDADLDDAIFQHQTSAEKRHDTKCSDALQRALSYAPTASYWWDYTTSPATIRFEDSAKLSADKTLSETAYQLLSGSIDPQYELMADSVTIYWLKDNLLVRTDTASGSSQAATLGANRPQVITLEVGRYIVPEEGLAAAVHKFYSRLHVNSAAVLASLDWSHRPGQLWAYGGIFAGDWTAFCHQITRDLFTETQTLNLGVPPAFGITKLSDSASDPSSSGGSDEPATVAITRTIEDPNSVALDGDSFFIINGVAAASGESIDLPAGSYVIVYLVPDKYIAPGQETDPPTYEELVVEETTPGTAVLTTGTASATVTATLRERLRLRAADDSDTEIDLRVADIPDEAYKDDPAKVPQIKLRELNINDGGDVKKAITLISEPYLVTP